MIRAFFVIFIANLLLSGCTQRMICPAYQSAYIYDKDELRKKFSYFENDTMPKVYTASKNKYLVAEDVSYKKKLRQLQTVVMKPVNVVVPDSLQPGYVPGMDEDGVVPGAELDLAARSVIDSTYIVDVPTDSVAAPEEDSVYMISKDKEVRVLRYNFPDSLVYDSASGKYGRETPTYYVEEVKFNVDQDNYMWYLRDYLVLPDVRLAHLGQQEQASGASAKKKKEKKGFFGFFKNLFKKKDKSAATDSTDVAEPPVKSEDDFDYVDEDSVQQATTATQVAPKAEKKEKKGLFGRKKKADQDQPAETSDEKPARRKKDKKKKSEETEEAPTEEEKQKEEEDGF
ncbi:hypothetical protein [Pseudochryseolinea flava]|uniref:Lipoprotein n=1 Tax=Pseudochryseolinea flava TaxID=2059302 RepID=A0A364XW44_9BACT|nr:hypothetical protein [Pseudochryseolinea flava]RAV98595.1 hypothetical protein DQQ10_22945 [Pseudochryseolinea flava]